MNTGTYFTNSHLTKGTTASHLIFFLSLCGHHLRDLRTVLRQWKIWDAGCKALTVPSALFLDQPVFPRPGSQPTWIRQLRICIWFSCFSFSSNFPLHTFPSPPLFFWLSCRLTLWNRPSLIFMCLIFLFFQLKSSDTNTIFIHCGLARNENEDNQSHKVLWT